MKSDFETGFNLKSEIKSLTERSSQNCTQNSQNAIPKLIRKLQSLTD